MRHAALPLPKGHRLAARIRGSPHWGPARGQDCSDQHRRNRKGQRARLALRFPRMRDALGLPEDQSGCRSTRSRVRAIPSAWRQLDHPAHAALPLPGARSVRLPCRWDRSPQSCSAPGRVRAGSRQGRGAARRPPAPATTAAGIGRALIEGPMFAAEKCPLRWLDRAGWRPVPSARARRAGCGARSDAVPADCHETRLIPPPRIAWRAADRPIADWSRRRQ
jgi:hypothetical protein